MHIILHTITFIILTLLTQIGGVVWVVSRFLPKYKKTGFIALYIIASIAVTFIAPMFGRVRLPALDPMTPSLKAASPIYWMLNRNFVTPELKDAVGTIAWSQYYDRGIPVQYLDGNFPFAGIPLLPHLSHSDGKKLDLALPYTDSEGRPSENLRSPIGYFAFEYPKSEQCPKTFPTLRWELKWLQPIFPKHELNTRYLNELLNEIKSRQGELGISKVFIEPHLLKLTNVSGDPFRFQGCRAARHDDHIHLQIR